MNEIDALVGQRIRALRIGRGTSQADLGQQVGVRFQQIQKYETGQNRVSASRLFAIAKVLDAPIEFFFEGIGTGRGRGQTDGEDNLLDVMSDGQYVALARNFMQLSARQKQAVLSIVESMSVAPGVSPAETKAT
jgi:transcriptional regulator with XRE-family HTH domain